MIIEFISLLFEVFATCFGKLPCLYLHLDTRILLRRSLLLETTSEKQVEIPTGVFQPDFKVQVRIENEGSPDLKVEKRTFSIFFANSDLCGVDARAKRETAFAPNTQEVVSRCGVFAQCGTKDAMSRRCFCIGVKLSLTLQSSSGF